MIARTTATLLSRTIVMAALTVVSGRYSETERMVAILMLSSIKEEATVAAVRERLLRCKGFLSLGNFSR